MAVVVVNRQPSADINMSAVGGETTSFSFVGVAPAHEKQGSSIAAVSQAGIDLKYVEDECLLTNMEKFLPELVNKNISKVIFLGIF